MALLHNSVRRFTRSLLFLMGLFSLLPSTRAYFVIDQPSTSSSIANGSPYPITWTLGLLLGIESFDIKMTRLYEDGIYYVATNVPTTVSGINILLQDVPESNDYYIVCLNSTDTVVYSVSERFSVTNSSRSNPRPNPSLPTATISGVPNANMNFAATLGPNVNGGGSIIFGGPSSPNTGALSFGGMLVLCSAFLGGVMALW